MRGRPSVATTPAGQDLCTSRAYCTKRHESMEDCVCPSNPDIGRGEPRCLSPDANTRPEGVKCRKEKLYRRIEELKKDERRPCMGRGERRLEEQAPPPTTAAPLASESFSCGSEGAPPTVPAHDSALARAPCRGVRFPDKVSTCFLEKQLRVLVRNSFRQREQECSKIYFVLPSKKPFLLTRGGGLLFSRL